MRSTIGRITSTTFVLLALGTGVGAQTWPEGWTFRTDRPDQGQEGIEFVTMSPGWHITTGPAAILYSPDSTASGNYRIEAETFMFDPQGRREAFGLIFGGRDLDGPDQAYSYFLVRPGGEFIIKRRVGSEAPTVQGWTAHPAILSWSEGQNARNVLAVDVGAETVRFFVNGDEVASLPRRELDTDGIVGLRVNHRVNVHVTNLKISSTE